MITTVREAVTDDAEAIARLHVAAWRWAYRGLLPEAFLAKLSVEARLPSWRSQLEPDDPTRVVVAEAGGQMVGFASFGPTRDAGLPPTIGELYALYLAEAAAGQGVGRALLAAVIAGLRGRGCTAVSLWVLDGNKRARRFYERAGFHADGATRVEVRPDHERVERRYLMAL